MTKVITTLIEAAVTLWALNWAVQRFVESIGA